MAEAASELSSRRAAGCPDAAARSWTGRRSVCLYTPSKNPSGMGGHMVDLAAEFVPEVDVTVMAWETPGAAHVLEGAASVGAKVVTLPRPRDPDFAGTIVEHLRAHPVDVFHVHVGFGRENFDGARAARLAGVPLIVQTQHLPWLLGSHKHRAPFFDSLEPVDRVIAVSQGQRATYERIGVPPERMTTVLNGIRPREDAPGRRAARAALGLDDQQPVVMTVGRLAVQKGQRFLLDAVPDLAARFPSLVVVVLGSGHLMEQLTAQVARLGIGEHVRLPGNRPDARALLDAADVFALPSRQEGMPLAALEAMDAGLPVVATRVIGTGEVVLDGETGLLVPRDDAGALGAALAALLGDPERRERYGRAGRRRFLEQFTSARMARDTLAVYEDGLRAVPAAAGAGAGAAPGSPARAALEATGRDAAVATGA